MNANNFIIFYFAYSFGVKSRFFPFAVQDTGIEKIAR